MSVDDAARLLESSRAGLTAAEAAQRLCRYGANELQAASPVSPWRILLDQLPGVVVILLIVATAISVAVGDLVEAAAIGGVLLINTALGFVIEMRARRAMAGLLRLDGRTMSGLGYAALIAAVSLMAFLLGLDGAGQVLAVEAPPWRDSCRHTRSPCKTGSPSSRLPQSRRSSAKR